MSNATSASPPKSQDTPASSHNGLPASKIELPAPFYPPGLDGTHGDRLPRPVHEDLPSVPQSPDSAIVLEADKATPDNWVPRDERMVRLTGKHPFNSECKLEDLYDQGFLTPSSLFYVRRIASSFSR